MITMFDTEKLKELIDDSGKTVYKISKDLGISSGHLYNLLLGKIKSPNFDTAIELANYFDVEVKDFIKKPESKKKVVRKVKKK